MYGSAPHPSENVFWSFNDQGEFSSDLWNDWGESPLPFEVSAPNPDPVDLPQPHKKVFFILIYQYSCHVSKILEQTYFSWCADNSLEACILFKAKF